MTRTPQVQMLALVQDRPDNMLTPATILIDGDTSVHGMTAAAMAAVAAQHPHLAGRPITALRYTVGR
jgi:hypothetical protein